MHIMRMARVQAALIALFAATSETQGASLSATPLPSVVAGQTYLARPASLGVPLGSFWAANSLYWNAAEEISVAIAVSDAPTASDNALVFFTVGNIGAGAWSGFEMDVSGPAQFITDAPYQSTRPFASKTIHEQKILFTGMDWPEGDSDTPTISNFDFSIALAPQGPDESIVLTLRPIAVPEPSSGLLLIAGALAGYRRRRTR